MLDFGEEIISHGNVSDDFSETFVTTAQAYTVLMQNRKYYGNLISSEDIIRLQKSSDSIKG